MRNLHFRGRDENTRSMIPHGCRHTYFFVPLYNRSAQVWPMHLSVEQFFLGSPEPIPFRTHLSNKTAHVRTMSGCQVIAVVTPQTSLELTFCIMWNNRSFSTPTTFSWVSFSLTCSSSPSCYVVCWLFITFLTLNVGISEDAVLAPGFVSVETHSLSDHMQSLGFKFHLYTDSFQTHIVIWASLLNSRQLEVHLIGTLNMSPRLLVIPLCWTCSFYNLPSQLSQK